MDGVIEALHIFDERNSPILSHTYTSRPLAAAVLLPLFLAHPPPRPNVLLVAHTNPPTLVFSLVHANLLFLATASSEIEPLLVLEYLHRVIDALQEFLGAPLISHKLEANYHVVAQLLTETCDAGTVATTEPNALRDLIEVEGWMGKLLGSITLPGAVAKDLNALGGPAGIGAHPSSSSSSSLSSRLPSLAQATAPTLPWRRANVRHTSNELYADVVETLTVTLAPSGRPLAAFANGTIAFTSKVSGVPDITLTLTGPSGKHNLGSVLDLPVFHPCVRLAKWREQPGVLSFIPPDGRFVLAGYEVDLLPFTSSKSALLSGTGLKLPVNIEMKNGLGPVGADFEVRVHVNRLFGSGGANGGPSSLHTPSMATGFGARAGLGGRSGGGAAAAAAAASPALSSLSLSGAGSGSGSSSSSPIMEDMVISIPLPEDVRSLPEIRPTKGDATYNPGDRVLQWHIPGKELSAAGGGAYFGLRCTVAGLPPVSDNNNDDDLEGGFGLGGAAAAAGEYGYDEPYQAETTSATKAASAAARLDRAAAAASGLDNNNNNDNDDGRDVKKVALNKMLMPSSASVSFTVRGWVPSGVRVESIMLDTRRSRGLGEGVKPYKGVKYLTVSKGGVEIRC